MMKKVLCGMLLCLLAACSGEKPAATGKKVVSLSPAVTDLLLAVDGRDALAGRSAVCADIPGVPVVGNLGTPFAESVLSSGANVILTDTVAPSQAWSQLEKCGVKRIVLPAKKLSDLPGNIRIAGEAAGRKNQAEILADTVSGKLDKLRQNVPAQKVRSLVVIAIPPVVTCGGDSFIHEALELAGAENISAAAGQGYFNISTEYIVSRDPEVIISLMPPDVTEKYFSRKEFRNVSAVKNKRFIYPDVNRMSRLTPQIVDETLKLRSMLVGDL